MGKECPSRAGLARVGGNGQLAGWGSAGWLPPSGRKWQGAQSCQGATGLVFPGPTLGKMQSEAAGRAGEPSGQGEEASSEGLGGHHLLTQTDARCPAGQVMRHHLHGQPGTVGGEAARLRARPSPGILENPRVGGANQFAYFSNLIPPGKPPRSRGEPSQPDNNYRTLKLGSKSISADHY